MNKRVIIFGAGGHGRVIADIVRASGDELIGFLDDNSNFDVLGKFEDYVKFHDVCFAIGIGNSSIREYVSNYDCNWYTAIHPSSIISPSVRIGEGTVVMPNVVINANSVIGRHCIINTSSVVEHDNVIEDYAHISVGAKLGGTVKIGRSTWVGIGSMIRNNISICRNCIIGVGSVVVRDITECGVYYGIPARKMK
ncbi:MAG: acetyltransferase [Lachnospiraceae bacterium]|nr:acetyltransferase [Lachnospiraceae bacterium]